MAVKVNTSQEPSDYKSLLRSSAQSELNYLEQMARQRNTPLERERLPSNNANVVQSQPSGEMSPLSGSFRTTQAFGNYNPGLYAGKTADSRHLGVDIATPSGTPVQSPFTGIVRAGKSKDFGNFVEVQAADGRIMRFSHLQSVDDLVRQLGQAGREIQAGQQIGLTGNTGYSTGPHLDVMYQVGGRWVDPRQFEPLSRAIG